MGLPAQQDDDFFELYEQGGRTLDEEKAQLFEGKDIGKVDTLRYNVSNYVVEERYEKAIGELEYFINSKSAYPNFKDRNERYVSHCIDLIHAIKSKRHFPGMNSLTKSKQKELQDRVHEHFNEMIEVIKKMEKIHQDMRIEDIRSTILIMKALSIATFMIMGTAFFLDVVKGGVGSNALLVIDDAYTHFFDWLSRFI
jgi:hypothetical protein